MTDSPGPDKKPGKIVTFYSYKGGTGRSLALANVAWLLAANGRRVLAIDWDLEAPGLHRYFVPFLRDPELGETRGVMDLLWDYVNLVLTPKEAWPSSVETPSDLADVRPYVAPLENPFADAGGCLHFLCAGQQTPAYAGRFRDFDWRALYERQGGGAFVDKLAERLRGQYEFVLIDSRTGVADTSGICTVHLPDEVVLCFTYNRQSVKGVAAVAQSIHAQRTPPPPIWPVPMRVEKGAEGLNDARDFAREEIDRFLPADWSTDDRAAYWASCEVVYYPEYAFGETLAVFRDRRQERNSLVADMRWLASRLVPADGELKIPPLDPERRDTILRRYRLRDPRKAELAELLAQPQSSTTTARLLSLAGEALRSDEPDEDYLVALGQALTKAVNLSGLDQPDAAHSLALATTELYRRLARERPSDFLPSLAGSLNNLGTRLSARGEREDALAAVREASDVYRRLAAERPDAFLSDLAMSLNNLSAMFSELGRREAALEAAQESVEIRRRLAAERPDAFLPDLAGSLSNLGAMLRELGRHEDSLASAREAVEIRRRLATEQPDAFLPALAGSLNNLGASLGELGRREDAFAAVRDAAEIYRRLAAERPDAFLPNLAGSLNNLGHTLNQLGRHEEALAATREATDFYRGLAADRSDAFLPALAMSVHNLGVTLASLDRREDAFESMREGTDIYRRLAAQRPDAFLPDLAKSLNNLSVQLGRLDRRDEALTAAREAVEIRRRLAGERPNAFMPDLAMSLTNLAISLSKLGRREDALAAAHEAVTLLAPFFLRLPTAYRQKMIVSFNQYLELSKKIGVEPDAALLAPIVEAFKKLQDSPDAGSPDAA